MSKRAERRHETARVKAWYRKNVVERWRVGLREEIWWFKETGESRPMTGAEREEYIATQAGRMATHPSCPCGMCKWARSDRAYHRTDERRWEAFLMDEEWE